ncbi:hypothetical protein BOX15_Mlig011505g1, partial [Macrostomum lignano]
AQQPEPSMAAPPAGSPADYINEAGDEGYCCFPDQWHATLLQTSHRHLHYLTGKVPSDKDIFFSTIVSATVGYKSPTVFEMRSDECSFLFWRGLLWLLDPTGRRPSRLLSRRTPAGHTPMIWQCLTRQNGFRRLNATHYRLDESDGDGSTEWPARYGTVTDIFVRYDKDSAVGQRRSARTCHLESFVVRSRYRWFDHKDGNVALSSDTVTYAANGSAQAGWPDND